MAEKDFDALKKSLLERFTWDPAIADRIRAAESEAVVRGAIIDSGSSKAAADSIIEKATTLAKAPPRAQEPTEAPPATTESGERATTTLPPEATGPPSVVEGGNVIPAWEQPIASNEETELLDEIVQSIPGITHEDLEAAYLATSTFDAVAAVLDALDAKNIPAADRRVVVELFPKETQDAATTSLFGGESEDQKTRASKDFLSMVYDGEYADNHDWMVDEGFKVKFQMGEGGDLNIYYVEPVTNRTRDLYGTDVGEFDPLTSEIGFTSGLPDARRPIWMPDGAFIPQGTGVNTVSGNPTMTLSEFWDSFGRYGEQQVTNKVWEDVLKDDLSLSSGMRNLIARGIFPFEEEFIDVDVQQTVSRTYEFLEGDEVNMLIDMPVEDVAALQQRYAAMGSHVYDMGTPGLIDPQLVNATKVTMSAANANYEGEMGAGAFDDALNDFDADVGYQYNWFGGRPRSSGGGGGGSTSRVWRPPAYLAPDYAELSQAVKTTFEQKLGRAPSDAEISLLSAKMGTDHRGEFDAQALAQRMQFFSSGGLSAGTVQDVNYAARFQEDFEDKYTDELGTLDRIDMSRNMTQSALGSILSADRAIGY